MGTRTNVLRVLWNRAVAQRNAALLKTLAPAMAAATKPRGRQANQPPNQRRAWRIRNQAYRAIMNGGGRVHVNAETAATVLRHSESPSAVIAAIARGANVATLTAADVEKRFHTFESIVDATRVNAGKVTAYARMLTELVRRGVPVNKVYSGGKYRHTHLIDPVVDAFMKTRSPATLELMEALIARGVKRTDFAVNAIDHGYEDWERCGLPLITFLMPTSPAARQRYLQSVVKYMVESSVWRGLDGLPAIQDLLDLGAQLTPRHLDAFFIHGLQYLPHFSPDMRSLARSILAMFRRAGIRASLPRSELLRANPELGNILREHGDMLSPQRHRSRRNL